MQPGEPSTNSSNHEEFIVVERWANLPFVLNLSWPVGSPTARVALPPKEAHVDSDEEAEDDDSQANDIDLLEDFPDDTDVRATHSVSLSTWSRHVWLGIRTRALAVKLFGQSSTWSFCKAPEETMP